MGMTPQAVEAVAWVGRRLRWERRLEELRELGGSVGTEAVAAERIRARPDPRNGAPVVAGTAHS